MSRRHETRPTRHVQKLVQQRRMRVVIPLQAIALLAVAALVWVWLAPQSQSLAFGVIGAMAGIEFVLLLLFLWQRPETDEDAAAPLTDTTAEMVLSDLAEGQLVVDRVRNEVRAKAGSVRVPNHTIRTVLVDNGTPARLMIATTGNELIVLTELVDPDEKSRRQLLATGRLLARAATAPFGEEE